MKRTAMSQPTDEFLETLSEAQLKAVYNAHRHTSNEIESVLLMNRITVRLMDLIGEDATERFINK